MGCGRQFPTVEIPHFGIPNFGIPYFGIPIFGDPNSLYAFHPNAEPEVITESEILIFKIYTYGGFFKPAGNVIWTIASILNRSCKFSSAIIAIFYF